ncbi:PQQ-binding-like beta-propeller repeat protein [Methanoculleus sp.]|uniref:WD40 repeat domain-containing protein n=1 Tax=Methanoculleus sp. TaxID=90427 RepID=UPI0025CDDA58|nr:PQQ-binding-like beta-propeller repeat protein [Methanoculleus sp.]
MRYATVILVACLLLATGVQAGAALWTHSMPSGITDLSLSRDGSYVLAGGERVCLLAGNGTPLWQQWVGAHAACSADAGRIVIANGQLLTLVDRDGALVWRQDLPGACTRLGVSADGKCIVVADRFGKVYFYNGDGKLRATADTRGKPGDGAAAFSEIRSVAVSEKGEYAAVASSRGVFYFTGAGRKVWAHEGSVAGGTAVAVSGNGNEVAVGSDASVRLLDRAGKVLWTHRCSRPVTSLAISGNGSRVLFGLQDNTLTALDREGEEVWTFAAGGWIRDIAFSADGSRLLAGGTDRQAYLLDGAGGLLGSWNLLDWVNHVAISADGTAGVAATSREVVGFAAPAGTSTATAAPTVASTPAATTVPTGTPTAVPTGTSTSAATLTASPPSGESGLPLLLAGLLVCGVVAGAGYLYRRAAPAAAGEVPPEINEEFIPPVEEASEEPLPTVEDAPPTPWGVSLAEGRVREAARILSREMTGLIRDRTGARVLRTADALAACPDQREDLARFFAEADRLAYGPGNPAREEFEALEAAYLRLAEAIGRVS